MPRHHARKIVLLFIAVLSAIGITVAQANHTDTGSIPYFWSRRV